MSIEISRVDARRLTHKLMNSPIAPGQFSHYLNVGTEHIIDALDENYFEADLADGISCFKYLEGDYGSGKTQFINSLAQRATERDIVTSLVTVGAECPFNSPAAIFRAIMESFQPPKQGEEEVSKGIDTLINHWICSEIKQMGAQPGFDVPENVQYAIDEKLGGLWTGAPDPQMATGLKLLSSHLLKLNCGATDSVLDSELIGWVRGDSVKSHELRKLGLFEPVRDDIAFRRLKTVIAFLRNRMNYKGFLIAFDEGTRTSSFRRGTDKQRQAIENLLSMINQNAEGEFGGVMFLYSATKDFRDEVISKYRALQDRIGSVSFSPGSPLVPLINIEDANNEEMFQKIGERLLYIFDKAFDVNWDKEVQQSNIKNLVAAQKGLLYENPKPRFFVYQYCILLNQQQQKQELLNEQELSAFVGTNEPPVESDEFITT